MNKNAGVSGSQSSNQGGNRVNQNDYDNNPKNIYKSNKSAHSQQRADHGGHKQGATGISSGGNNIIMEMEAEQNDDESYYLSNSPARRGVALANNKNTLNNKSSALSNNPSSFGQADRDNLTIV